MLGWRRTVGCRERRERKLVADDVLSLTYAAGGLQEDKCGLSFT